MYLVLLSSLEMSVVSNFFVSLIEYILYLFKALHHNNNSHDKTSKIIKYIYFALFYMFALYPALTCSNLLLV